MSRRLPLFPLDLVLFPGTRTPLHIFEDRYRTMLRDALAGEGAFGLLPAGGDAGPAAGTIGCVARVISHQPLPDGRSNILVEGDRRFILRRLLDPPTPYLQGLIDEFDDEEGAAEVPADAEATLRHLADRCRRAMSELSDLEAESSWSDDPAVFTFEVAGTIPWDATQSRPLLAMRSAAERADLLLRLLPNVVPDLERRAGVHRRAGSNGRGGGTPAPAA
jgi:Lon protease-like protein